MESFRSPFANPKNDNPRPWPRNALQLPQFKKSIELLNEMESKFVCVKCKCLPGEYVYTLGYCFHKYCSRCITGVAGKPCVQCHKTGDSKMAKQDLFSTGVMSEISIMYDELKRFEDNLVCTAGSMTIPSSAFAKQTSTSANEAVTDNVKDRGNVEPLGMPSGISKATLEIETVEVVDVHDMDEITEMDNEITVIESTPQGPPESPDVLAETPQNKPMRHVIRRASRSVKASPRNLFQVDDDDKSVNANETTGASLLDDLAKVAVPTLPGTITSETVEGTDSFYDEDLFGSYDVSKAGDLPVLTPHAALVNPGNVQIGGSLSRKVGNSSDEDVNQKSLLDNEDTRAKVKSARVSDDNNPPSLTPYPKTGISLNTTGVPQTIVSGGKGSSSAARKPVTRRKNNKRKIESVVSESEPSCKKISKNVLSVTNAPESGKNPNESFNQSRSSISGSSSSTITDYTNVNSLNKRNAKGETPLQIACRNGHLSKVKQLLDNGADTNVTDNAGWTPLHDAINGKGTPVDKASIVNLLCESGANVNVVGGFYEDLPLHEAAQSGNEEVVEILLRFGAYSNIRNKDRKLPRDVAFNQVIVQLLDDKGSHASSLQDNVIMDGINLQKARIYFCFDVPEEVMEAVKVRLNLKVADRLTADVTHIIYYQSSENDGDCLAPLSWDYLQGLGRGLWQLGYQWIVKSIHYNKLLEMAEYEVTGCMLPTIPSSPFNLYGGFTSIRGIPELARKNQEEMNPRLLDGMSFYFYSFGRNTYKRFSKKELAALVVAAGGKVSKRQPDPDFVDPVESPVRFHAKGDSERFVLTSHVILYSEEAPPPDSKKFTLEHVKTLKIEWLIDSIGNFALLNPDDYL